MYLDAAELERLSKLVCQRWATYEDDMSSRLRILQARHELQVLSERSFLSVPLLQYALDSILVTRWQSWPTAPALSVPMGS